MKMCLPALVPKLLCWICEAYPSCLMWPSLNTPPPVKSGLGVHLALTVSLGKQSCHFAADLRDRMPLSWEKGRDFRRLVSWVSEVRKPVVPCTVRESPPWSKSRLCPQNLSVPASRSELEREGGSRKGRHHTFVFALQNAPDGLKISWDLSVSILVRRPEDGARTSCARLCWRVTFPPGARETEACFLPVTLLFPS